MGIHFENVTCVYRTAEGFVVTGINRLDLRLSEGRMTAIIGEPGSGKSTLIQLLNGILQADSGRMQILDFLIENGTDKKTFTQLRKKVGLVFQFPEQQLFAETVEKELMFGPLQCGLSREEARQAAHRAAGAMNIPDEFLQTSPFQISSGLMRKTAIASVLAMDPELFVLDEPAASLDPASRSELMRLLGNLCREQKKTVILVTHRLDDVIPHADEYVILQQSELKFHGSLTQLLEHPQILDETGLAQPAFFRLMAAAARMTGKIPGADVRDPDSLAKWLAACIRGDTREIAHPDRTVCAR